MALRRLAALALLAGSFACSRDHEPRLTAPGPAPFPGAPVVLISIDTLRADHLPAYGYREVETPHIDALRKAAILFASAFSHSPLTLPSHASAMTGLLPPDHGVRDNLGYRLDGKSHPTLARLAKDHGYATGAAVSAFVLRAATGLSEGFDFYDDAIEAPAQSQAVSQARRPGGETVARAVTWLDGAAGKPVLFFLHLYEPHAPYEPPEPFRSLYAARPYDGEIAAADAIVGTFVKALRDRGLYDRAVVILFSDHGEGLGDHGEDEHGILLYREALHVPLLIKLPGSRRAGETVAPPAGLADLLPTVAGLVGLAAPPGLTGRPLLETLPASREVYSETFYPRIHLGWNELRSLWDGQSHFIDAPKPELYRTDRDPGEKANLFAAEGDRARALKRSLDAIPARFDLPRQISPEEVKKLASLGYLSGAAGTAAGPLPNPVERIGDLAQAREGFRLAAAGQHVRAVAAFRGVLAANPRFFDVQYRLAQTLQELGRHREAFEAYRQALTISPSLAGEIAIAVAREAAVLGEWDAAETHARLALRNEPAAAHEILARAALARGDLAGAEREATLAAGDRDAELRAATVRAEVRLRRNEPAEALSLLDLARERIAREKLPPARHVAYLRGDALARLTRYPEAEKAFREEIRAFPDNSEAYARLAILLAVRHRTVKEVHDLIESMYAASPTPETALLAAKTLESIGDRAAAAAWRSRAKKAS
ncbi:MAG TPA: sulfatase-like hydrolase/transferase [Thermoanaerobaculia bacterium]|nr:sulfatase-like hydrolase/transferase [Thermoanaerobaculia bacterium]